MFSRSLQAAEEYYRASLGLLIVLQGLDASGKDSTIKHVMSGLNFRLASRGDGPRQEARR